MQISHGATKLAAITHKTRKYSLPAAQKYLASADPVMGELIRRVGPTRVRSEASLSVYQSLLRAIVYQMLSTKSASAIYGRLVDSCGNEITPAVVSRLGGEKLREIGFSRAKVKSVEDLNAKIAAGEIPDDATLRNLDDAQIIETLTQVVGIGQWTVEMLLIFNLRRPDVLPVTDLGVRKGHMLAYGLADMLKPTQLASAGECWAPYRSVAGWYLWRATDSVDW